MRQKRAGGRSEAFPRTPDEFDRLFPTESACLDYLAKVRWPGDSVCPRCPGREPWKIRDRVYRCRGCGRDVSVTAGTVLHRSHVSVRKWFSAAHMMTTLNPGVSARQIQKELKLATYEAALYLTRRLRRAMVDPVRKPLAGEVDVDTMDVGKLPRGERGRAAQGRKIVAVGVQTRGDRKGCVVMEIVPEAESTSLTGFINRNVAVATRVVRNDLGSGWGVDPSLGQFGGRVKGRRSLSRVDRVIGDFKNWWGGSRHGRVSPQHLQEYLDEFTFWYNSRQVGVSAFDSLWLLAMRAPLQPTPRGSVA